MDTFEQLHKKWLDTHLSKRQGDRKRRLQVGHAHGEKEMAKKIWLPAFGHFQYLHPEYEVKDFLEGRRYLDFAYIRGPIRVAIEVDGMGKHLRDISRREFCDERVRQMHLTNAGWTVVRIGYDDLNERPLIWQQLLQQMIGRLFGAAESEATELYSQEREIIRLALRLERPIKLKDVCSYMQCGYRTAREWMTRLEEKRILLAAGGGDLRTHSWKLDRTHPHLNSLILQ